MSERKTPEEEAGGGYLPSRDEFIEKLRVSFRDIDYTAVAYLRSVIIPSVLGALIVSALLIFVFDIPGFWFTDILVILLSWFAAGISVTYPYIVREQNSKEVRENFHLFVTHFTALAISNVNRMEVFRQLAHDDTYGVVSKEMRRIVILVDTWNQSLDNSCLIIAQRTSSDLLANFLERLAHSISAGQAMPEFIMSEQEVMIEQYSTKYKADIERIKVLGDTYLAFMISLAFTIIFAVISPILTNVSPIYLIASTLVGYVIAQIAFAIIIHTTSPEDFLWYIPEEYISELHRKRRNAVAAGISSVFVISGLLIGVGAPNTPFSLPTAIPIPFYIASVTIPTLFVGFYVTRLEKSISDRDDQYPGFIRGLGTAEHLKQSSTSSVLRNLRTKDFGDLTPQIISLYRRLISRINDEDAWKLFSAETGSYLTHRFSEMYRIGREFGANTHNLSEIISRNFTEVLKLREHREQATSTLTGLVYGLTATASFAFFVSVEVVVSLIDLSDEIEPVGQATQVINLSGYNVALIEALMVAAVISTAAASAAIIRISQRKSLSGGLLHFSLLVWIAMIAAYIVQEGFQIIL